ncbi:MATE family efflux transporter [Vibrio ulleungensis]|uniref:Na+-driven multidrug efflux pump n=1 Tax=Vibrio ulleungensis TaxID=2807619 RepID=A0ABS2HJK3_9VIBR|nr:hypothetical protein [Vibrio ulleungensis]MBM7037693.1 hypothetical protein [Vibrio ulleungensis]
MTKNTVYLYLRLLFTMLISIYISRVLLDIMGVDDFGIFSVVTSSVTMFSFLNNSLAYGTQRFITYEIGKGNNSKVNDIFLMSVNIHFIFSTLIIIFALPIGYYLIYSKLNIPPNKLDDAFYAYVFVLFGFFITLLTTPYSGVLIASERFDIVAILGVLESILKLSATFFLYYMYESNVLTNYAILLFIVSLIVRGAHVFYVNKNIDYCSIYFYWNSLTFKRMFSFSSWGLFGGVSSILMNQGINIILNIFFGPAINAARSLSLQVSNAMSQFSSNLQMVFRPRIIKSYASQDESEALTITLYGAKYNYLLILYLALPIVFCSNDLLGLWLGSVPEYTSEFLIVLIFVLLSESLSGTLMALVSATGKIKKYQVAVGIVLLLNLPITYVLISKGYPAIYSVYIQFSLSLIALCVRLAVLENQFKGLSYQYLRVVIVRIVPVTVVSYFISDLVYTDTFDFPLFNIIYCFVITSFSLTITSYCFGLEKRERGYVLKKVKMI